MKSNSIKQCTIGLRRYGVLIEALFISLLVLIPVISLNAAEYETPGIRKASVILPSHMLSGKHYRVRNKVVSYGYMHHYTVDSDFGVFEVTGDGALRKLIKEIGAIAQLRKVKKSDTYIDSVKKAGKMPIEFGRNLIDEPVDTVTGVPKGVFRLFSNAYTSVTSPKDPSEDKKYAQILAMSAYKRDYAYELGVDVYSSNAVLQKELNSLGWAGALGSLSVSAALAPFRGSGAMVVKATRLSQQFNDILKENPPAKLREMNEVKLSAMRVSKQLASQFLDHPHFTPRHDTIIVRLLERLKGVRGRDAFISFALSADDEESATFVMNIVVTMSGYSETVSPIKQISINSGLVIAQAKNGSILIPFPLDRGVWTERADRILSNLVASYNESSGKKNKFQLWVTGTVSKLARKELELIGIKVTENVDERIVFVD